MNNIDLVLGNSIETLKEMEDNKVDLIVTSPPYNVGIKYNTYNDTLPEEEYWEFTEK